MLINKTLETTEIEMLHEAFVNAFSDYQVKIDLPLWKFKDMLQRRGYAPDISIGAFKDEKLVGFVLNGFRTWNGKSTVYDVGTGVIPDFRKQGVTSNILVSVRELLKEKKVERYLLEVIQTNTSAVNLYRKQGFEVTRDFSCFRLDKNKYNLVKNHDVEHINRINLNAWELLCEFWDFKPSWQNSIDSINALSEAFNYSVVRLNDTIIGYGIIDRKTGDIPQIAVNKHYRHKGIGSSLITDLVENTEAQNISIINVDDKAEYTKGFLSRIGFEYSVSQHEMILKL